MKIVNRHTGELIYETEKQTMTEAVREALAAKKSLSGSDLRDSDLRDSDLRGSDLSYSNLRGSNLRNAENAEYAVAVTRILPEGDLIGWKKCKDNALVKLLIPSTAKRSSAFGRKCRAECVKVLEVIGADVAESLRAGVFYKAGETVTADKWDEDFTIECSNGIHFFITRLEAESFTM